MKRFVTLTIAVILMLSIVAAQAAVSPEPTIKVTWTLEDPSADANNDFFFEIDTDEAKQQEAEAELNAIANAQSSEDYFGADAVADALAVTGGDDIIVTELAPVIAGNYKPEMGNVTLNLACPTLYEDGQKVAVMFKLDEEWTVFEGIGNAEGEVVVTLDPETIQYIEDNGALMAIAI